MNKVQGLALVLGAAVLMGQASVPPGISVEAPWMRYLLPSLPASGYLTLNNAGDTPAVLTGAASPACYMLMLHKSEETSGTSMMVAVPSITIPAHGSISLAPGGYHLMCMQPRMKAGGSVHVTLSFEDGLSLAVTVPVYGAGGPPQP